MRLLLLPFLLFAACQQPTSEPSPTGVTGDTVATPNLDVQLDGAGRGGLDAFEDRVRSEAIWLPVGEGGEGVETEAYVTPGGFQATSKYYLALDIARPATPAAADVNGVLARLTPATQGLDVTSFTGVSFALQGQPGTYIVQLGAARVQDAGHYNAYVTLPEGGAWTRFDVPFTQFKQESYAQPVPWTGTDLVHLGFFVLAGGPTRLAIDDVLFY